MRAATRQAAELKSRLCEIREQYSSGAIELVEYRLKVLVALIDATDPTTLDLDDVYYLVDRGIVLPVTEGQHV